MADILIAPAHSPPKVSDLGNLHDCIVGDRLEHGWHMRIIKLAEVEFFVKHTLKVKLQKDLRNLRILKEGDVEWGR